MKACSAVSCLISKKGVKRIGSAIEIRQFSQQQLRVLNWWLPQSTASANDAVICDGAVRSGKTLCMSLSFAAWISHKFDGTAFALCGKTIGSLRRNILMPVMPLLQDLGFFCSEKRSENYLELGFGRNRNRVYLFGGKDQGSAALIQGMTLGGAMFDEAALMPRSFVEQAIARCSLEGAKLWFNCNPEHPQHWFYKEWIEKAQEKNALYLHFTMDDNPSLSPAVRARYRNMYSGTFYQRFIEGKWTAAEGLVYPMFSAQRHVVQTRPEPCERYVISCDYGTVNPSSFGLWGQQAHKENWIRLREYYWDSRARGQQRTDEEHYRALEQLAGALPVDFVVCDPSAASFMECIRRHGRFTVLPARNDVLAGIRLVADALLAGQLTFHESCTDCIREFGLYVWDEGGGRDSPRKENDHAMDDVRYFAASVLRGSGEDAFFAGSVVRNL